MVAISCNHILALLHLGSCENVTLVPTNQPECHLEFPPPGSCKDQISAFPNKETLSAIWSEAGEGAGGGEHRGEDQQGHHSDPITKTQRGAKLMGA